MSYCPTAIPTQAQLDFADLEMGLFLHFGIRSFHEGHRDWDGKPMDVANFNPAQLDCNQWMRTAKQAGFGYAVMTAKHHDGFANWPSKFTDFSVTATPWKDGKGDVVRDFVDACRANDVQPGIYYSPAQWGGSAGSDAFHTDSQAYDDYFINQITELLDGTYGEINYLWFDGCGSEDHEYDWTRIVAEIRRMQPKVMIFNMAAPDYRWVGNESGLAPRPLWNTVRRVPFSVKAEGHEEMPDGEPRWLPAECDFMMRDANWFFEEADTHTVKSLAELMGIYYYSVGRGANMLLNIGPDRRGLLPDEDAARLLEFGSEIKRRFSSPVATFDQFTVGGGVWTFTPDQPMLIDHAILMEDLAEGEHVCVFDVTIKPYQAGVTKELVVYEGRNVGHKAICRFPLVRTAEVKIRLQETTGQARLRDITLHQVES